MAQGSHPGRSGDGFGAYIYKLWRVGRQNLPTVANVYAQSCNDLAATSSGVPSAYVGSEPFGGSSTLQAWTAFHDAVQVVLADTATNLELTGEALCTAANAYAATDDQAAASFRNLMQVNGSPAVVDVPDPIRPTTSTTTAAPAGG